MKSQAVLRRAVDLVGADRILKTFRRLRLNPSSTEAPSSLTTYVRSARVALSSCLSATLRLLQLSDTVSPEELATRRLENGLIVKSPKDSTIVSIQYVAASPTLAHDVVDAVAKVFLEEHLTLNQSEGSLGFFSEQSDSLHKQLVAARQSFVIERTSFELFRLRVGEQFLTSSSKTWN